MDAIEALINPDARSLRAIDVACRNRQKYAMGAMARGVPQVSEAVARLMALAGVGRHATSNWVKPAAIARSRSSFLAWAVKDPIASRTCSASRLDAGLPVTPPRCYVPQQHTARGHT